MQKIRHRRTQGSFLLSQNLCPPYVHAELQTVVWCGVVWLLRRERERDDDDPRGVLHHASFLSLPIM